MPLDDAERSRLATLEGLTVAAVERAGVGAWIERKPASVVLHIRQADPTRGIDALADLERNAGDVEGATTKLGNGVLELFARPADKGVALLGLAGELGALTTVFVGDDTTDEEAFARLRPGDIAIKVGDTATIASHRLRDPDGRAHVAPCPRELDLTAERWLRTGWTDRRAAFAGSPTTARSCP